MLIWIPVGVVIGLPVLLAAFSPYLAFRSTTYIVAGFSGILCLSLFVLQPLLPLNTLNIHPVRARWLHRVIGLSVVALTLIHVGGLYLTSPPDVIDALLLRAPTLFSVFGVFALWGVILTLAITIFRIRTQTWRIIHQTISSLVIIATAIHALQIEGAMEPVTKWVVCVAAVFATALAVIKRPPHL